MSKISNNYKNGGAQRSCFSYLLRHQLDTFFENLKVIGRNLLSYIDVCDVTSRHVRKFVNNRITNELQKNTKSRILMS